MSSLSSVVCLLVLVSLMMNYSTASSSSSSSSSLLNVNNDIILSPESDSSEYKFITLQNKLEVVLISNSKSDMSGAAMSVGGGSFMDPLTRQGIAHFCEHMLFLGTQKYPDKAEYHNYMAQHAGLANAMTDTSETLFHFTVSSSGLAGALDRFSSFFVSPLFSPSSTYDEMHNIDSEFHKNLLDDEWRQYQMLRWMSNRRFPFFKFSTGNIHTLNHTDVTLRLREYHDKYYTANLMKLVVYSSATIDQLQSWVTPLFSLIPNHDEPVPHWSDHPYPFNSKGFVQQAIIYKPIKSGQTLTLYFPLPSLHSTISSDPSGYVSYFLGHESVGSLYHHLSKSLGWVISLTASNAVSYRDFAIYWLNIQLSPLGLLHVDTIIEYVFAYLALIRENAVTLSSWSARESLLALNWRFQGARSPNDCPALASKMQWIDLKARLLNPPQLHVFDEALIKKTMDDYFTPQNMFLHIQATQFDFKQNATTKTNVLNMQGEEDDNPFFDQFEPYFQIPYTVKSFSSDQLSRWINPKPNPHLALPPLNPYVPKHATLNTVNGESSSENDVPSILFSDSVLRVWYRRDTVFPQPKTTLYLNVYSHVVYQSPHAVVMTRLYVALVTSSFASDNYMASLAGFTNSMSVQQTGIQVQVNGFTETFNVYLTNLIDNLFKPKIDQTAFDLAKSSLLNDYFNFVSLKPYEHALYFQSLYFDRIRFTNTELRAALLSITLSSFNGFIESLLAHAFVEGLVYGTMDSEQALNEIVNQVHSKLIREAHMRPIQAHEPFPELVMMQIAPGSYLYQSPDLSVSDPNSCVVVSFQFGSYLSLSLSSALDAIAQVIHQPCFDDLRTKRGLGYIVWCYARTDAGSLRTFNVVVLGSRLPAHELDDAVEQFLTQFYDEQLLNMTEDMFRQHMTALKASKQKRAMTLTESAARDWDKIQNRNYNFNRQKQEIEAISLYTIQQLRKDYKELLLSSSRRRFSVEMFSSFHSHGYPSLTSPLRLNGENDKWMPRANATRQLLTPLPCPSPFDVKA